MIICDLCCFLFLPAHQLINIMSILHQFTLELKKNFFFLCIAIREPRELSGWHSIWGIKRYWIGFCCLTNHSKIWWLKTTDSHLFRSASRGLAVWTGFSCVMVLVSAGLTPAPAVSWRPMVSFTCLIIGWLLVGRGYQGVWAVWVSSSRRVACTSLHGGSWVP